MGMGNWLYTRYQALPGNVDPEALPPIFPHKANEAEPLDMVPRQSLGTS
jgi:hypothetical protein